MEGEAPTDSDTQIQALTAVILSDRARRIRAACERSK